MSICVMNLYTMAINVTQVSFRLAMWFYDAVHTFPWIFYDTVHTFLIPGNDLDFVMSVMFLNTWKRLMGFMMQFTIHRKT